MFNWKYEKITLLGSEIIKVIRDISSITINNEIYIDTYQYFNEDESKITLRVAEYIPQFVKGFVCDMKFSFLIRDTSDDRVNEYRTELKDLVLVYILKNVYCNDVPEFEYVFYK